MALLCELDSSLTLSELLISLNDDGALLWAGHWGSYDDEMK